MFNPELELELELEVEVDLDVGMGLNVGGSENLSVDCNYPSAPRSRPGGNSIQN
jgi:hypothetical protein